MARIEIRLAMFYLTLLAVAAPADAQKEASAGGSRRASYSTPTKYLAPTRDNYLKLADETESALRRDVLEAWFPRTLDKKNGGFRSEFSRDWQTGHSEGKFSVFQGRMTWIAAQVAMRRPDLRDEFLPIAQHGLQYLSDTLWDKQYGGFYWGLNDSGQVSPP